jgi:hypothetical protein
LRERGKVRMLVYLEYELRSHRPAQRLWRPRVGA